MTEEITPVVIARAGQLLAVKRGWTNIAEHAACREEVKRLVDAIQAIEEAMTEAGQ